VSLENFHQAQGELIDKFQDFRVGYDLLTYQANFNLDGDCFNLFYFRGYESGLNRVSNSQIVFVLL